MNLLVRYATGWRRIPRWLRWSFWLASVGILGGPALWQVARYADRALATSLSVAGLLLFLAGNLIGMIAAVGAVKLAVRRERQLREQARY